MMDYAVVVAPEGEEQLAALYRYTEVGFDLTTRAVP